MSLFPETIFDLVYEDRTTGADEPENRSACPADEALIESVNRFGRADPAFISSLTGKTPQELLFGDLKSAVFQDPAVFQNGVVAVPQGHSSGQLASAVGTNCLAEIPPISEPLPKESRVKVWLL